MFFTGPDNSGAASPADLQLLAPELLRPARTPATPPRGPPSLLQEALIEDVVPLPEPVADHLSVSPHTFFPSEVPLTDRTALFSQMWQLITSDR